VAIVVLIFVVFIIPMIFLYVTVKAAMSTSQKEK